MKRQQKPQKNKNQQKDVNITTSTMKPPVDMNAKYINRELSWLEFNERVLEEARDKSNPLMERLKFLAITSSNLDEFFMIRVASLKDLVNAGYSEPDPAGLTPSDQLIAISAKTHKMVQKQYSTFNRALIPALEKEDIRILKPKELSNQQIRFANEYFNSTVYPILTPLAVDAGRPFPLIGNKSLNLCVRVEKPELLAVDTDFEIDPDDVVQPDFAIIQIPSVIPRLLLLPEESDRTSYILLEDVVRMNLAELFGGVKVISVGCFRIMRNADLDLEEEEAADLLKAIEKQLKMRQWGQVIRLEAEDDFDPIMQELLIRLLPIEKDDLYEINGPLDLTMLFKLKAPSDRDDLHYQPYKAQPSPMLGEDLFAAIRSRDVLLHHPYEQFDPVVELIRTAAQDPNVLAIKQTLYRVSGQSPIIASLADAAEMGKQVMVLVELKARFDEENNINWARKLEQAGCHVIYGLVGLKTHSKITLIVRRDEDGIRRYVHLGTGNYNDITAGIYTDFGLLTCAENIGHDASAFFNMLSGYSEPLSWRKLIAAPYWLRPDTLRRIRQETRHAQDGKPARIIVKINSLVDEEIIGALYEASQAGVEIDLIVRGICCLRPGVPGLSDNIRVRSIIGRFLEHSRIFYYHNDGQDDLFLASADWMPRNLDRRVEIMFPIEDGFVRSRIMNVLKIQLADTDRSRIMQPDGSYQRVDRRGKVQLDCQIALCEAAVLAASQSEDKLPERRFIPVESDWYVPDEI
ncbi:MAG: RNA degradosome polyphosphate kinase [Clostridiaceae bacterium]|nr:RNA degradosome polyphosphate kinase [Clostridiaceae bacterium]